MSQNLLSVRERPNAFDDHTLNETRIMVVLVIQVCACEAILIFSGLLLAGIEIPPNRFPVVIGLLTGGTLIYYLLQLLAYGTIGYVFTDATGASQWLKGFNATQALLGFLLLVPALAVLFLSGSGIKPHFHQCAALHFGSYCVLFVRVLEFLPQFSILALFYFVPLHRGNNSGVVSVPGRIFTMSFIIKLANPHKPLKE